MDTGHGAGNGLATVLAALLLALTLAVPLDAMRAKSPTYDEVAHLPAGYSYWVTGRIRLNPEHPPFIKLLCALPLLALDLKLPLPAAELARGVLPPFFQWEFGQRFFCANDAQALLWRGRLPVVFLSLALAFVVLRWATELWGRAGGLLALFFYATDPTVAGHAYLVTTDLGLAAMAALCVWFFRDWIRGGGPAPLLAAGAALGLALGTKYSGLALVPVLLVLAHPLPGEDRVRRAMGLIGLFALAALVLWAVYFFTPEPLFYLDAMRSVNRELNPGFSSYLMGETQAGLRWYYLPAAWLLKTPLVTLLALAAALVAFARRKRQEGREEAFLVLPPLAIAALCMWKASNLGVRYLIPATPFLCVFAGRLAPLIGRASLRLRGLTAVLVVAHALSFAAMHPDHTSYFNELTGGSRNGWRWLDDSNVDWGQGLLQVGGFLAREPGPYTLYYFGSADPACYGLRAARCEELAGRRPHGRVILSAHCAARLLALLRQEHGSGPDNWLEHAVPVAWIGHAYLVFELP